MASVSDADWQLTKKSVLERNKHMFNNPLMSDVTFTCGESERKFFYAHKYVLATSSPSPEGYPLCQEIQGSLEEKCWENVDNATSKALESDLFPTIDRATLEDLLKRDTLEISGGAGEIKLIEATLKWCDYQCSNKGLEPTGENRRAVLGSAVNHLRFFALTQEEFARYVSESGLLTESQMIAFFKKFGGMTTASLTCSLPSRKGHSNIHPFVRFAQDDLRKPDKIRWTYSHGDYDCLAFTVNKPVLFHGVRLFGDGNGGEYKVTMTSPVDIRQTYTSTSISEEAGNCFGFDVMFPDPVILPVPDLLCKILVKITGPKYYYGVNGRSKVELDGIIVDFSDSGYTSNGTDSKRGQIYGLLISHYYGTERN